MSEEETKAPEPVPIAEDYLGDIALIGHHAKCLKNIQEMLDIFEGPETFSYFSGPYTSFGVTLRTGDGPNDYKVHRLMVGKVDSVSKDTPLAQVATGTAYIVEEALRSAFQTAEIHLVELIKKSLKVHATDVELKKFTDEQKAITNKRLEAFCAKLDKLKAKKEEKKDDV